MKLVSNQLDNSQLRGLSAFRRFCPNYGNIRIPRLFMKLVFTFLPFTIPSQLAQTNQETLIEHFKAYNNADIKALDNSLHAHVSEYT